MTELVHNHVTGRLSELEQAMIRDIPPGGNWRHIPTGMSERVDQIKRRSEKGIVHTTYYGRLRGDRPSYTINTYFSRIGNGCFLHPHERRLISLREGARLQSFPDRFVFHGPRRAQYQQIGNAVPPLLAYAVGRSLGGSGTLADLFCGAGGLSLGLELAGFTSVLASDHDEHAIRTFNNARADRDRIGRVDDLAKPEAKAAIVEAINAAAPGGLDLLAAGPPCQSFSTAGNRNFEDLRASLLWAPFAIAQKVRPRMLLIENVHGILSAAKRTLRARIAEEMHELALEPHMCVLRAEEHGVPQRRTRVFFVGIAEGAWEPPAARCARTADAPSLFVRPPVTVDEAISDLPPITPGADDDPAHVRSEPATEYQSWARGRLSVDDLWHARSARLDQHVDADRRHPTCDASGSVAAVL